ncbi:MAG: 3-dehydroquinate synthase [Prevotella sp.]|nr:3-dehydroquinate synthase [Prevotella sp.]
MKQEIIISKNLKEEILFSINKKNYDKVFVLVDSNTKQKCLPIILPLNIPQINKENVIEISPSDSSKNLDSLSFVWQALSKGGASRHSLLINLGGGMVTDLGGFAASTFKRGIDFINIPTTLLAMVDASVGGKTGINFLGLKNEIGVFQDALSVIINTEFLKTLDEENLRSGYAEMLKHGLIKSEDIWRELLNFDIFNPDFSLLQDMVRKSIGVKEEIVEADPREGGLRKALNFGHTFGHSFESLSLENSNPLPHGYAVAFGMISELYLSHIKTGFPLKEMRQTINFIKQTYGEFNFTCDDYEKLLKFMTHDKKNSSGQINFTLLGKIGDIKINQVCLKEEILEALDFLREGAC